MSNLLLKSIFNKGDSVMKRVMKVLVVLFIVGFVRSRECISAVYPVGDSDNLTYTVSQRFNTSYEDGYTRVEDGQSVRYYGHTGVDLRNGRAGDEVRSFAYGQGAGLMVKLLHLVYLVIGDIWCV